MEALLRELRAFKRGGRGVGITELLAIEETIADYRMDSLPGIPGLKNVGPTLALAS
jgi:hypothetical protein